MLCVTTLSLLVILYDVIIILLNWFLYLANWFGWVSIRFYAIYGNVQLFSQLLTVKSCLFLVCALCLYSCLSLDYYHNIM